MSFLCTAEPTMPEHRATAVRTMEIACTSGHRIVFDVCPQHYADIALIRNGPECLVCRETTSYLEVETIGYSIAAMRAALTS